MAAPTIFASVVTNPGSTGSTITPTLSTHAAGDVLEIFVAKTGNVAWSAPAGWTTKQQLIIGTASNGLVGTLIYRRVLPGDTLPLPSPTCTLGATVTRGAICQTRRGADVESVHVLTEWLAFGTGTGTANPVRPSSITTPAPEMEVSHYYCQRAATNAPEPTNYTQTQQIIISGTLVVNVATRTISDQQTTLSNQDASPTSGARWVGMISAAPSPDYPYYRAGSQAFNANATSVTPALPTGTSSSDNRSNKDLLVATVECAGTPTIAPNTPADWTELPDWSNTTSGGGTTVRKYRALYDGTLDRQFNRSTSGEIFVYFSCYHNAHQTIPVGTSAVQQNASSTTSTFPALSRTGTKATVQATCVADATPTFTAPSGWTERNDSQGVTCADQSFDATGTTASASFTLSSASPTLAGLMEVFSVASVINLILTPATATLELTSFAPTIVVGVDVTVTPDSASLTLTTFTPAIVVGLPFPATTELDNFNRADGGLGANWGGNLFDADGTLTIDTNAVRGDSPTVNNNQGWVGQFGPDCEVWVQILSGTSSDLSTFIAARWSVLGTDTPNGYAVRARGGDTNNLFLMRFDNGALTGLAVITQEVDDGDWLGLRVVDDRLDVYFKDVSGLNQWAWVGGTTDSTYSAAGHIGLLLTSNTIKSDNFGGGTLGSVAVEPGPVALILTGFTPLLQLVVTPANESLSLTTFTPAISISAVVTPASAPLSLTTFAPSLTIAITIPVASLLLTTFTPVVVEVIAFPSTGVLDNFNRADEGPPPSSDWTTGVGLIGVVATVGHQVVSNQMTRESGGDPEAESYWSARTFGPDCEIYVTVTSGGISRLYLGARLQNIGSGTTDGYVAAVSNSDYYQIRRIENGIDTLLIDLVALPTISSGNRYGLQIIGPLIRFLVDTGSGWEVVAQTTDSVFTSAGYIGLFTDSSGLSTFDDFGGGTVGVMEVTPASVGLVLSTFVVQLRESLTPASATLTLTTFAPSVTVAITVTPATATLSLTTFAPTVDISADVSVTPATASLTLITFAVTLDTAITPVVQSLTLSTFASTLHLSVMPAPAALTTTTFSPQLLESLTPTNASLALTSFAPSLTATITPASASLSLSTFAPAVTVNTILTPASASLTLATFSVQLREVMVVGAASLTLTAFAPEIIVSADITVTSTPASLALTTFAPDVIAGGDLTLTPATAVLTLTGFAPTLSEVVIPASGLLVLTTFAPKISTSITPAPAGLVLSAFVPSLHERVTVSTATLTLITFAPTITITGAQVTVVTPAPATLTLTSYVPWLFLGLVPANRTYMIESGRYEVEVSAGEYEFLDSYEDDEVLVF